MHKLINFKRWEIIQIKEMLLIMDLKGSVSYGGKILERILGIMGNCFYGNLKM